MAILNPWVTTLYNQVVFRDITLELKIQFVWHDAFFNVPVYTAGWLEGAKDGVEFLFDPDWDMLTDPNIWAKAASQILFSLSVGFGSQLVLSSYNR